MVIFDDLLCELELSPRERQMLELVAGGRSAKQIAQTLGIAPRTVERHIENIRNKLRVRNRTHMVTKALAYGLIHLDHSGASPVSAIAMKPKLAANE